MHAPVAEQPDELFEPCPMCGHWEMTEDGRCANCGEPTPGSNLEIAMRARPSVVNWRSIIGLIVMAVFSTLILLNTWRMESAPAGERTFLILINVALTCCAFIGFTLLVQGVFRALRSRTNL